MSRLPMPGRSVLPVLLLAVVQPALLGAAESRYVTPVRVSAHPFRYHYRSVTGAVVLADFELSPDGRVRHLTVRRGESGFRGAAAGLVRGWRFEPPAEAGEDARVALIFLFRRPQLLGPGSPVYQLGAIGYPHHEAPPQPRRILEPNHPARVATDGLGVVGLTVDPRGAVTKVTSLYGPGEFLRAVQAVVRRWTFEPARKGPKAVIGGVVVVVYFPRPTLGREPTPGSR